MALWLILVIATVWLAVCVVAVSLCVMAARGDRADAAARRVGRNRHTARRPLRRLGLTRAPAPQSESERQPN